MLFPFVLTGLLLVPIGLVAGQVPLQRNHVIKFIGMRHEYEGNPARAKLALVSNLRLLTSYRNITIDEISDKSTSWSVDEINAIPGCPEKEISHLMSLINKDGQYTRLFKMAMEDFDRPRGVQLEGLGPCDYLGRKRSQVLSTDSDEFESNNLTDDQTNSPTEGTAAAFSTTTIATTSIEPTEPATITDEPIFEATTTAAAMVDSDATTASELELGDARPRLDFSDISFDSSFSDNSTSRGFEAVNKSELDSIASIFDKTLAPTITATTTTMAPFNSLFSNGNDSMPTLLRSSLSDSEANLTEPEKTIAGATTPASTPARTTLATDIETSTTISKVDLPGTRERGFSSETIENIIAKEPSDSTGLSYNNVDAKLAADDGPYYGKYIGLGMGFLIFVAYLVCCRSSRRQGSYEVQAD